MYFTGKSFPEALILASVNPQYDEKLFNSYCGLTLTDSRMRASDTDFPVKSVTYS